LIQYHCHKVKCESEALQR